MYKNDTYKNWSGQILLSGSVSEESHIQSKCNIFV